MEIIPRILKNKIYHKFFCFFFLIAISPVTRASQFQWRIRKAA